MKVKVIALLYRRFEAKFSVQSDVETYYML